MEWKTKLPNIPKDTYGPAFEPTIIAAINELRAAIGGTTAPEACHRRPPPLTRSAARPTSARIFSRRVTRRRCAPC